MKKSILIVATMLVGLSLFANWEKELIDSRVVILKGIEKHDQEDYEDAIEQFNLVHEGDTNYVWALYEKSLSFLANEDYEECIEACLEGIEINEESIAQFHTNLANAYDENDQYEKAIETYDKAIELYPVNFLLYYNRGVAHQNQEKMEEALEDYRKALFYNPYHSNSHLRIGGIALDAGEVTQGSMAWMMYMLLNPGNASSFDILASLDYLLSNKGSSEKTEVNFDGPGDDFEEIDAIVNSQIALNSKYKFDSEIDAPVIRQFHAVIEKLQDYEPGEGFCDKFYVPYFREMYQKGLYSGFSYYIMAASSSPKTQKTIVKKQKEIEDFSKWTISNLGRFFKNRDGERFQFYSSPSYLYGKGKINADENEEGEWTYYHTEGVVAAKGNMTDGVKTGKWEYFYIDQTPKSIFSYNDEGDTEGEYKRFHENGNLAESGNYADGKQDGLVTEYFNAGGVSSEAYYKEGELDGLATVYHYNGTKKLEIEFEEGERNGSFKSYFANGKVMSTYNNEDGEIEGEQINYHVNGEIAGKEIYKDGKTEGPFEYFYSNGKTRIVGSAKNGKLIGSYKKYHVNGNLKFEVDYDENGKYTGTYKEYDLDNKLFYEADYVKGDEVAWRYYNKEGELISEIKAKGKTNFKSYYPTGELYLEGLLEKGMKSEKWTTYFISGDVMNEAYYTEGEIDGKYISFYKNGQKRTITNYKKGEEEGYYQNYNFSGYIVAEGRMHNDEKVGVWKYYTNNGTLASEEFYVNGKLNGPDKGYDPSGRIDETTYYKFGEILSAVEYDTLGEVYSERIIDKEEMSFKTTSRLGTQDYYERTYKNGSIDGKLVGKYLNGKTEFTGAYINGERDGNWDWYLPNGEKDVSRTYVLGEREGAYRNYDFMGNLKHEYTYVEDDLHGPQNRYFPDGTKMSTEQYIAGVQYGLKDYYDADGNVILSIYINDEDFIYFISYEDKDNPTKVMLPKETGVVSANYPNGNKAIEFELDKGVYSSAFKMYYEDGTLRYMSSFENGSLNGQRIFNYPSGKTYFDHHFTDGNYDGEQIYYSENGKVLASFNFKNDDLHGSTKYYDANGSLISTEKYYYGELIEIK